MDARRDFWAVSLLLALVLGIVLALGVGIRPAAAQFGTPTVDGTIATNEYGVHSDGQNQQTSGSQVWYMTWDATNLYVGISGANVGEGAIIYLDKDPLAPINGGSNANGTIVGFNYDGTSFAALQFRADLVLYVKNGYREYRTADGANGWSSPTTGWGSYADNGSNVREFALPWSAVGGRPSSLAWFGYLTSSGGYVYGPVPTENAGGYIGTSARYVRYYIVNNTGDGTSTKPFSRNCYVFNSTVDISDFGALSVYDFTMNTSGRTITRSGGAWTIAGAMRVDSGTVSFGAVADGAAVSGDVVIGSGGVLILSSSGGGDLGVGGNWSNNGTFSCNGRQVIFNGGGAQSVGGSATTTFDYLLIDNLVAGEVTLVSDIVVLRELKINDSSAELSAGSATITMLGDASGAPVWINNGTFNRGTGTVAFAGENNRHARVLGSAVTTFNNVTLSRNGGGSGNFGVDFYDHDTARRAHIAGTLTLNQYTFVASEEDGSSTSCVPSNCDGTPIYDAGSTLRYQNSGSFDSAAEWWPDDADPLCGTDKGMPYNVVIDNSTTVNINAAFANNGQSPNYGAGSNKTACGSITIASGSTLQSTSGILSVKNDWTLSGAFTHNNGTVRFNGNGGGDSIQTVAGDTTFYNLTLDAQAGTTVYFGSTTTTVAHDLDKTGGSGSMDPGTGRFAFNGSPSAILGDGKKVFYDLEIASGTTNHTSGSGEIYIHRHLTNNGTLVQASARRTYFSDEQSSVYTTHNLTGGGTTTLGRVYVQTSDTVNAGSHSFSVVGDEFQVGSGSTFNGGTATVTFRNATPGTDLSGAGTYNFAHLVIDTGATLLAVDAAGNAKTMYVAGNWTNNGTFTHNSGRVVFNGTSTIGGSAVTSFFDLRIETGCSLSGPAGTVNIHHDWTNNGTYNAGTSTVVCNGTTPQVIGGSATTTFSRLTIDNAAGVSLGHAQAVNTALTLNNGLLTLGAYDLVLGAIQVSGGPFDSTRMVVADGAGSLCRRFTGMSPFFTWPIGDNTAGANYSPVRMNFYFIYGQPVCVRVTDAKHPNNPSTTDYLTRYWTVNAPGIAGQSTEAWFYYVDGAEDVVGNESAILAMMYESGAWTYDDPVDPAGDSVFWDGLADSADYTGGSAPTAVRLLSFAGRPSTGGILLTWETAGEADNLGFHLYRSTSRETLGGRLNQALIPSAAPGGGQGAVYEFLDSTVEAGITYHYTLVDVDFSGRETPHGPVVGAAWWVYMPLVRR